MEQVAQLIAQHEGLRLKPYKCTAGKITIGYGRNLDDNGISEQEAEAMLVKDISGVYTDLSRYEWFYGLDEVRAAVLVDMCYNLGINRLSKFEKTLKFIELGQYLE
ncbi:MAG: lysozyme, partial [Planctomycetes bacterium]|nr:lysozyme [Planctomycetota bacterium]